MPESGSNTITGAVVVIGGNDDTAESLWSFAVCCIF